jgi:hypothetical protein
MRKFILIAFFLLAFSLGLLSCGMHNIDELSDSKIAEALQEALFLGSKTAADNLSTPCNGLGECATGYLGRELMEIALPDTVENVLTSVNSFMDDFGGVPSIIANALNMNSSVFSSFQGLGDNIKKTLNRGAEQAAPKSIDLFKKAIFEMPFSDARNILFGNNDTAATSYLKRETFVDLQGIFGDILKNCLNALHLNSFWHPIASNYNSFATAYSSAKALPSVTNALNVYNLGRPENSKYSLPPLPYENLPEDISEHLSTYATGRALEGLFYMVGVQESKLRADPWGEVSRAVGFLTDAIGDLLGDVFSKAKEG